MTELHIIADNEMAQYWLGGPLRVCGRCESQTYYQFCPECTDEHGLPLELHEGQLTNTVAAARALGKPADAEDVFKQLERMNPYRPIAEDQVVWHPEAGRARVRAQQSETAQAARAMTSREVLLRSGSSAEAHGDG